MKPENKKKERYRTQAYTTLPFLNTIDKEEVTEISIPTEDDMEEAREWVNFNEK